MMSVSKRILSAVLALVLVVSFAACSGDGDNTKDTDKATATTTAASSDTAYYEPDELPELDFGGETVTILSREITDVTKVEISVEELSSNIINDSIYNRELFVEDRLGVEIDNVQISGYAAAILTSIDTV